MKKEDREQVINIINVLLRPSNDTGVIKEEDISKKISQAIQILGITGVDEKDIKQIYDYILETHSVQLERGVALVSREHKKWFQQKKPSLSFKYWNRFAQYLAFDKHFPKKVIHGMDLDSDEIVDLLGNPNTDREAQRRGLIIGDVQSGKTANYSGVICKAVDAGYRVIILLTGTSNDLRKQTQIRLDEAFLGFDSAAFAKKSGGMRLIGVGKYDSSLKPIAVTNADNDFNVRMTQLSMELSSLSDTRPMLFVCKKNVSVLRNLYDWIVSLNKYNDKKINNTLLMIDDEADYASINTRDNDDPTATNKCIRNILNEFRFASYVGFTATPYANIFIDPPTEDAMQNEDLFPADYIYTLESPSNYIGARNIFGPKPNHGYMLREIDDAEEYYSFKHKKDWDFRHIAPSLKKAINVFLIANVLRDLDGDEDSYRSMMINVSRFVNTQNQLHEVVEKYVQECQKAIMTYSHLQINEALDNEYLRNLHEAFDDEFSDTDYSWHEVQSSLERSIVDHSVLVLCANQGNKDLDYGKYEEKLRAIIIGGQALSRGLTLEGLMVSYIYRNSMAYDTLMQMGRWFGYRDHYDRYCRIYMDPESESWYSTISDATDELRNEVKRMRERGAIPLEFGLKVRDDPETPLIITARNKMRGAQDREYAASLSGIMIETQSLYSDDEHNKANLNAIRGLVESGLVPKREGKRIAFNDVPKERAVSFLKEIRVTELNTRFDCIAIAEYIESYAGNELDNWDIVVSSGNEGEYAISDSMTAYLNKRRASLIRDDKYVLLNKNRLGSPQDMSYGLTTEQKERAIHTDDKRKNPSANDYLSERVGKRKPLLMIYLVKPCNKQGELIIKGDYPAIGFSIGIPHLEGQKTHYIRYKANKILLAYGEQLDDQDEAIE